MLIECPACHARATLPPGKRGAKVRCGECGRVYVALPPGERVTKGPNMGLLLGGGIGVLLLMTVAFLVNSKRSRANEASAAPQPAADTTEVVHADETGWDGPAVQLAASIHDAAHADDVGKLRTLLDAARIFAWKSEADAPAELVDDPAALATWLRERRDRYLLLPEDEKQELLNGWIDAITRGDERGLVADWRAYDGRVADLTDDGAVVHLDVTPRSGDSVEKRTMEWRLVKDAGRWKAWRWERWLSDAERKAQAKARRRDKGYEVVELSDGSTVFERQPEPLEHLPETSPELRARIDGLYATMLDLGLTKESSRAQRELVEIGRPAIPVLLTGLYETPLDTEENAIRCNLIDQALQRITGFDTGFKPQVAEGSGTGTTEERRQSSIKQWFAWWHRNERTFTTAETEDALEGLIELTDKDREWLERHED